MGSDVHRAAAAAEGPIPVGLVTVSDTRTPETDENGIWLREQVAAGGNRVSGYHLVRDEPEEVRAAVDDSSPRPEWCSSTAELASQDATPRTTRSPRCSRRRSRGSGELFRMLSFEQVGAAAMLSRATAGTYRGAVVVSMPGSPKAVRLAWEKLLEPELAHLAWEVGR